MTPIRDQIIHILAPHSTTGCQDDCQLCATGRQLTDPILTAVAGWMVRPGHDFRLGLALGEALRVDPEDIDRAAMAVAAELAAALRPAAPAPDTADRPAVADRYAALPGGDQ